MRAPRKEYNAWINMRLRCLKPTDKVYTRFRGLNYLFKIPIYYAHVHLEALVDIRLTANNPSKFFYQLLKQRVTHLLILDGQDRSIELSFLGILSTTGLRQWIPLAQNGCLRLLKSIKANHVRSRTLQIFRLGSPSNIYIYHITPEKCRLL